MAEFRDFEMIFSWALILGQHSIQGVAEWDEGVRREGWETAQNAVTAV